MPHTSVDCRDDRAYEFQPAGTALLVIDMQRDFFADEAGEDDPAMCAIVPRVARLIDYARTSGCQVIYTREGYGRDLSDVNAFRQHLGYVGRPGPLGQFLIRGEHGHDIRDDLSPRESDTIIDKAGFSAFHQTDLDETLRASGVDHLILCGVTTQCCVHSTLRDAVDLGYWCLTVADCCAASEPELHDAALSLIAGEGHLFGWVCDVADVECADLSDEVVATA